MKFIFLLLFLSSFISGCSCSMEGMVWKNISERGDFVICGEGDGYRVSLMCGMRERNYKTDGLSNELIPYGVITLCSLVDNIDIESVDYILYVGTRKYNGNMVKNYYDDTWVADIKEIVDKDENISIDLYINHLKSSMKLNDINADWKINSNDAVGILIDEYKSTLKSFIINGEFKAEVFVKLINDYDKYSNRFYYNVVIYNKEGEYFSVLLCPKTGDVLASTSG